MAATVRMATPTRHAPSVFGLIASVIVAAMRKLSRALKNRQQAGMLAEMDERMLADIGLTRSDLRDAYAEPLWRDPTDVLAGRVRDKRQNRPKPDAGFILGAPPIAPDQTFAALKRQARHWL